MCYKAILMNSLAMLGYQNPINNKNLSVRKLIQVPISEHFMSFEKNENVRCNYIVYYLFKCSKNCK